MSCGKHGLPRTFEEAIHYISEHSSDRIEHVGRDVYMIILDNNDYSNDPYDSIYHLVGKRAVIHSAQETWDAYNTDSCVKCGIEFPSLEENWIRQ